MAYPRPAPLTLEVIGADPARRRANRRLAGPRPFCPYPSADYSFQAEQIGAMAV
ncbi:MAG: hypothetical protein WD847_00725 [Pirellulales bacterium]